ncbi:MAG: MFS transporter, partial [Gemmataceae bacterium]
ALVGAGLMLASVAHSLVEVYAAYGLGIGLGVGCAYVPAVGAVQRWFVKRRGFATGLAVSGIGMGTLVMPPLASHLIHALGWRETWLILGGISAILGIGMSLLVEDNPGARGLAPDGGLASTETRDTHRSGASVGEAMKSRQFIALYAACLFCSFGVFVPFVHLVPYAMDHGITRSLAVLLLGVIGAGSTAGRFVLGGLADRMGRQLFLRAMFLGIGLALAIWVFATGLWTLVIFALLFGVFYGGWVAILPAVVMDYFGDRHVGAILGILYTSVAIGTLIGPSAAGFIFNLDHGYTLPIAASAGANILAAIIASLASKTTRKSESKRLRATSAS